jgi:sigma-B regulation protein RsbU (phosphoserine phosphatase)
MLRSRLPAGPRQSRRTLPALPSQPPPAPEPLPSTRHLLLHSWAGRLFIVAAGLKLVVALIRRVADVPGPIEVLSSAATIGLAISVGYFVWRLFLLTKRRLLWRVRRKLILSYVFIGVVPALLIIGFFTLGAWVVSINVSAYLFRDGYDDIVNYANLAATAAASEIARTPTTAFDTVGRVQRSTSQLYRTLSMAFIPSSSVSPPAAHAGTWRHALGRPDEIPSWITTRAEGFAGTIAYMPSDQNGEVELVVRAVAPVITTAARLGYVVVDVPVDAEILQELYEATGVKAGEIEVAAANQGAIPVVARADGPTGQESASIFRRSVTILDTRDWATGTVHRATLSNTFVVRELYEKLAAAQSAQLGASGLTFSQGMLLVLMLVAILFLIIQFVALVMGLALARSITSSIHELFMGTERVRHGDFTHRINIVSNDQLGELAASFNQMTGSVENLLQTAAEKKRLEEELRIARQIQMSLLPRGPLDVPGLTVTALCVPAREVGGDYYDFFPLPQEKLGVLIADVSGKGTSAALYMAELKGLVLSLSQIYQSPRQLLLEVNRIISENLDSRSFITMTYAVIDLAGGTMTYARAGHTPLIYMRRSAGDGNGVRVLVPSGMVLGLRIPGAEEKFAELLEEDSVELGTGDVIVFYTDGITEAMNPASDLFGESRLSRIVEEHGHLDPGELRERILREIETFVGHADQHDDMTMILMKIDRAMPSRVAV